MEGGFFLSTLKEPYRVEGKKTMGLELLDQLDWEVPDVIFYPTGGGTGLIGMWKAFAELVAARWIEPGRLPRLVAVQAAGCAPIVRAFEQGLTKAEPWLDAYTVASGIRVPVAIGDFLILQAIRETGGSAIAVSDQEIQDAVARVAAFDGLLMSPGGGATFAGFVRALESGLISSSDRVVLFNCGNGLKYEMPHAELRIDRHVPVDWSSLSHPEAAGGRRTSLAT